MRIYTRPGDESATVLGSVLRKKKSWLQEDSGGTVPASTLALGEDER